MSEESKGWISDHAKLQPRMATQDEDEIAFHEAAHAVVDTLHGLNVVDVILYDESNSDPENPGHQGICRTDQCLLDHMSGTCLPGILAGPISTMEWNLEWSDVHSKFVDMQTVYSFAEGTDMYLARESALEIYKIEIKGVFSLKTGEFVQVKESKLSNDPVEGVRQLLSAHVNTTHALVMEHWDLIGKVSDQLWKKRRLTGAQVRQVMRRHFEKRRAA